jgi:hypothetical protein
MRARFYDNRPTRIYCHETVVQVLLLNSLFFNHCTFACFMPASSEKSPLILKSDVLSYRGTQKIVADMVSACVKVHVHFLAPLPRNMLTCSAWWRHHRCFVVQVACPSPSWSVFLKIFSLLFNRQEFETWSYSAYYIKMWFLPNRKDRLHHRDQFVNALCVCACVGGHRSSWECPETHTPCEWNAAFYFLKISTVLHVVTTVFERIKLINKPTLTL